MPSAPLRPCTTPGCGSRVTGGRCDPCIGRRRAGGAERGGGSAAERGYDHRWRAIRLDYLIRHPYCDLCGRLANVADHYPQSRRELLRRGVADPDADHRLRPLCDPHHRAETATRQPGGWNRNR